MHWAQLAAMCNDIKEKIARRRMRIVDDRKIAETLKSARTSDEHIRPFRPDDREKRHEFSQHIGC